MNTEQQRLLERLKNALDDISKSPATAAEVVPLFEDLVVSFEQIADDLKTISDEETASTLKAIIHITAANCTSIPGEQLATGI